MPFGFRKRISLERFNLRERSNTVDGGALDTHSRDLQTFSTSPSARGAEPALVPPTLVVEPSSDGSDTEEILLLKPRSNSYSNTHEIGGEISSSEDAYAYGGASDTCVGGGSGGKDSNWFLKLPRGRRRGRSLDVPKTCVHCMLEESWDKQKGKEQTAAMAAAAAAVAAASAAQSACGPADDEVDVDVSPGASPLASPTDFSDIYGALAAVSLRHRTEEKARLAAAHHSSASSGRPPPLLPPRIIGAVAGDDSPSLATPPPSPAATAGSSCFLQVPELTIFKPRASSLDTAIYGAYGPDDSRRSSLEIMATPDKPRAVSVDVNLPTEERQSYRPQKSPTAQKAAEKKQRKRGA